MVTLQDVANRVGVSKMTVSNVLNGKNARVSERTRQRVLAAVKELGYVRSAPARALSVRGTNLVSFVYPKYRESPLVNTHDAILVGDLQVALDDLGYLLILYAADDIFAAALQMKSWNVAGTVLYGTFADEVANFRGTYETPIIFIDNYGSSVPLPTVVSDDRRGGYLAGSYLKSLGHERVAFVAPKFGSEGVVATRFAGFLDGIGSDRDAYDRRFLYEVESIFGQGRAVCDWYHSFPAGEAPTALFCTADSLAAGVMKGLQESGVRIPADASVIGFDDLPIATEVTPSLTTVHQDLPLKARRAAEMIVQEIENPNSSPRRVVLPVSLEKRGSAARPAAGCAHHRSRQ
ncbi:LacI family DNA-binding transcriptional regulator [Neoactinobaculum massilliense]|uniref:LacI family DNA-binding transcriptional regulator n=1 Tax=Neoactinobaculum massilliense TaxID=2364794 RepID=UPI000F52F29C|nr:LacI family DNA-binding transcriptional regulator [Neoactinobaculum massilliense]